MIALGDVTVHTRDGQQGVRPTDIKSVILTVSDTLPADVVPDNVLEDIVAGRAPRLKLVTEQQAKDFKYAVALDQPHALAEAEALVFSKEQDENKPVFASS